MIYILFWVLCFDTLVTLLTQPTLTPNEFPPSQRIYILFWDALPTLLTQPTLTPKEFSPQIYHILFGGPGFDTLTTLLTQPTLTPQEFPPPNNLYHLLRTWF